MKGWTFQEHRGSKFSRWRYAYCRLRKRISFPMWRASNILRIYVFQAPLEASGSRPLEVIFSFKSPLAHAEWGWGRGSLHTPACGVCSHKSFPSAQDARGLHPALRPPHPSSPVRTLSTPGSWRGRLRRERGGSGRERRRGFGRLRPPARQSASRAAWSGGRRREKHCRPRQAAGGRPAGRTAGRRSEGPREKKRRRGRASRG